MLPPLFDAALLQLLNDAKRSGLKISVFDDAMRLVWYSPDWQNAGGKMVNPAEPIGHKWLEFVHAKDLPAARTWMQAGDGAEVEMRCLDGTSGKWLLVRMTKRRIGAWWVAVGDNVLLD